MHGAMPLVEKEGLTAVDKWAVTVWYHDKIFRSKDTKCQGNSIKICTSEHQGIAHMRSNDMACT